ncbi:MAG: uroporphyrinogen-III synthase [Phycisphaerales bacterium]|nr:MAG: uroporphyrinogen-III synthase [Phycisphaerales bacterium]
MRVWVTREEGADGPLSTALRNAGLDVVLEPVIERCVVSDVADEISKLGADDWLVLTSAYAIEAVSVEPSRIPRVAVVADPSRKVAEALGFRVELVSSKGDGKSLFAELREKVKTGKVCYPRSALVKAPEPWASVEIISPILYTTQPRPFDRTVFDRVDVVAVASPSAVNAIGPTDLPLASIGPSTSAAIRELGMEPWLESPEPSFQSLADGIAKAEG